MVCLVHYPQCLPLCLTQVGTQHTQLNGGMFPCRAQPWATCRGHQVQDTDGLGISPCVFRPGFVQVRSLDCGHPKNHPGEILEILVPRPAL